jgi:hypothetical protein
MLRRALAAAVLGFAVGVAPAALAGDPATPKHPGPTDAPSVVRLAERDDGAGGKSWELLVNGRPFYVRGAGLEKGDVEQLAARGGNAFRTWRSDEGKALLDRAKRNGLFVALGLDVRPERHGFDYGDTAAVAKQLEGLRAQVRRFRGHPALLAWVVGNELNLEGKDPRVWDAVEQAARMIHAEDPDHPVLTTLAGFDPKVVAEVMARAPSLDLVGIQLYGDIVQLPKQLAASGWSKPYIVTEWGPTGHWESPKTPWDAPVEQDSTRKAAGLLSRYRNVIAADTRQGLGSFVFLWGQKQERTPTWYGLFLPGGESTAGVDAMHHAWTGAWPANRAPAITPMQLDGHGAEEGVVLAPGQAVHARVDVRDPDGDAVDLRWTLREETRATTIGGDREDVPATVPTRNAKPDGSGLRFTAPRAPGDYRLFVEVRDGQGHAAHANLPFRVAPTASP